MQSTNLSLVSGEEEEEEEEEGDGDEDDDFSGLSVFSV